MAGQKQEVGVFAEVNVTLREVDPETGERIVESFLQAACVSDGGMHYRVIHLTGEQHMFPVDRVHRVDLIPSQIAHASTLPVADRPS